MKTIKNIAAVACVAALAVPAGVAAKGPNGNHGKSGDQHGTPQNDKQHHANNRCKHQPNVGFTLGGTLDPSSTASNIVVNVTHANKHSQPFVTNNQFTVAVPAGNTTLVQYDGPNPFTTQGADLSKYTVQVIGKVAKLKKGCTADSSPQPTLRKVVVTAPGASTDQPNQEQSKTQS